MKFEVTQIKKWKDILGYEGWYQASNIGEIKRIKPYKNQYAEWKSNKILKPTKSRKGYLYVTLRKNDLSSRIFVHRIIAKTYIPNYENKPYINHIDGNPLNNNVSNLEWCTQKENMIHCYNVLKHKSSNYKKYGEKSSNHRKVIQLDRNRKVIKIWDCIKNASLSLNIKPTSISNCLTKRSKTAGGFIWEYYLK